MSLHLNGILLPATTTFSADGALDGVGLAANISAWNETGVTGYVVLGSTGERVHLDEGEYVEAIEAARQAVPPHFAFIAGAGRQSTVGTIKEIARAARAGAEAVLVITPSFYRAAITQDALVKHYTAVADASPIPVVLYSMPDLTGIRIEMETAARLSEHVNIIGMKDSSADVAKFAETVRLVPAEFAMMIGNGTVLYDALRAGARAAILAVGCAVPHLCVEIYRLIADGDITRASALQQKLTPLARAVTKTYGIGGLKTAMDLAGYVGGAVRAPLQRPDEAATAEIRELLNESISASNSIPRTPFEPAAASAVSSSLALETHDA